MNKMETQRQKVRSVTNILLTLLILLCSTIISYSQSKLRGNYCKDFGLNDFGECITFNSKNEFQYFKQGNGGIFKYGSGDFKVFKEFLVLNFNKTEPLKVSYHESEIWENEKDSINIKFTFYDLNNAIIYNTNIMYDDKTSKNGYNGFVSIKNEPSICVLKKEDSKINFSFSNIGFMQYNMSIDKKFNYNISVFLHREGLGLPIKNQIDTLNIVENSKKYFKVKDKNGKIVSWNRKNL